MKKIVAINYFEQRVDLEGLNEYKSTEEYEKEVEAVDGDWAFAQLQDRVESYFTSYLPVSKSEDDSIVYDHAAMTEYGITLYLRGNNGIAPVARFKFDNATLTETYRSLTEAEVEMARQIIETEHLDGVVA